MSNGQQLKSELDDLERKLRRLVREIEGGSQTDLTQISQTLRRILRNEVDNIERIARNLN